MLRAAVVSVQLMAVISTTDISGFDDLMKIWRRTDRIILLNWYIEAPSLIVENAVAGLKGLAITQSQPEDLRRRASNALKRSEYC